MPWDGGVFLRRIEFQARDWHTGPESLKRSPEARRGPWSCCAPPFPRPTVGSEHLASPQAASATIRRFHPRSLACSAWLACRRHLLPPRFRSPLPRPLQPCAETQEPSEFSCRVRGAVAGERIEGTDSARMADPLQVFHTPCLSRGNTPPLRQARFPLILQNKSIVNPRAASGTTPASLDSRRAFWVPLGE